MIRGLVFLLGPGRKGLGVWLVVDGLSTGINGIISTRVTVIGLPILVCVGITGFWLLRAYELGKG